MEAQLKLNAIDVDIYKRYSFKIILSGILCLTMIGLCVAMIFLPVASFSITESGTPTVYTFTGKELLVSFFTGDSSIYDPLLKSVGNLGANATFEPGIIRIMINLFMLATPMLFFAMWFHCIFLAIFGIKFITFGKANNLKGPTSFSRACFVCVLLISGVLIAYNFLLPGFTNDCLKVADPLYSYIFLAAAIAIWVTLHAIYFLGLKGRYCSNDVEFVDNKPTVISSYAPLTGSKDNANHQEQGNSVPNSIEVINKKIESNAASIGLPSNIKSIGSHAFSGHLSLRIASIPLGIPSLGDGAFANCGNLCILSIPKSVKSIGMNCFFNCQNLKRINYDGTKADWAKITRGSNWLFQGGTNLVTCIDGTIVVDPLS